MVLPLIPVALIAVGALTGSGGVALGGLGARDIVKAKRDIKSAGERYDRRYVTYRQCAQSTNNDLVELGDQQVVAIETVVFRFVDFLKRNERQVKESEKLLADGVESGQSRVPGAAKLSVDPNTWLGGAIGSVAVAGGTSAAILAATTSVGVASTGAAISGLSGAAATNATMAALGGGSLAAGGGGMALGAAALNVVTVGPALLVGGLAAKSRGKKATTEARERCAEYAVGIAKLDEEEVVLNAVSTRAREVGLVLGQLTVKAVATLDELESQPFDPVAHAALFGRAAALTKAVADVATVPIVDGDNELTDRSANVRIKYRPMVRENDDV